MAGDLRCLRKAGAHGVADRGHGMRFDGTAWADEEARENGYFVGGDRVVAVRQAGIADPTGGATVDNEARSVLMAILAALRTHGLIAT